MQLQDARGRSKQTRRCAGLESFERATIGATSSACELKPARAEGDQVVVEFEGEGRTKDGRDYNNRYCSVFRIANGRITHIRENLDTHLARCSVDRHGPESSKGCGDERRVARSLRRRLAPAAV